MPLPPIDLPPTANEASRSATRQAFFLLNEARYRRLANDLNTELGLPKGVGTRAVTMRAIPEWEDEPKDDTGKACLSMPVRMVAAATRAVAAQERTQAEHNADRVRGRRDDENP